MLKKKLLLIMFVVIIILSNCNNPDPGSYENLIKLNNFTTEIAFPGEKGDPASGFALIKGEVRYIEYMKINGLNIYEGDIVIPDHHILDSKESRSCI